MSAAVLEVGSALEPGTIEWRGVRVVHEAEHGLHAIIDGGATRLPFGDEADVAERAIRTFVARELSRGLDALDSLVWSIHRALVEAHREAGVTADDVAFSIGLSTVIAWVCEESVSIAHIGRCRAHHLRARMPPERLTLDDTFAARVDLPELPAGIPAGLSLGPYLGVEGGLHRVDVCRVVPGVGDALVLTSPIAAPGIGALGKRDEHASVAPDELARRVAVRGAVESARAGNGAPARAAAAIVIAARPPPSEGPYR